MAKKKKQIETELLDQEVQPVEQEVQEVQPIDEKTAILMQFADFWNTNCAGHSVTTVENAKVLWNYWQELSGRTDRFNGCTPCIVTKLRWMKKLCIEKGIEVK